MENPLHIARRLASKYTASIQQDHAYGDSTYWSSRDILNCLTNASWGFDRYLKECSTYEALDKRYKDEGGHDVKDAETQNTKFAWYHQGCHRWLISSAYHARAIYGELWVVTEKAQKGHEEKTPA